MSVVQKLPLKERSSDFGPTTVVRRLGSENVRSLLGERVVRFVVADAGRPLRWIPPDLRFTFWKAEALAHVANPAQEPVVLSDYPDEHAFFASLWEDAADPIVLLEKVH